MACPCRPAGTTIRYSQAAEHHTAKYSNSEVSEQSLSQSLTGPYEGAKLLLEKLLTAFLNYSTSASHDGGSTYSSMGRPRLDL